mgnify:CR=1 FL=1
MDLFSHTGVRPVPSTLSASFSSLFQGIGGGEGFGKLAVVRFAVPLIKELLYYPFWLATRIATGCRFSTEVESLSSTDFSVGEHELGEASKIRASATT